MTMIRALFAFSAVLMLFSTGIAAQTQAQLRPVPPIKGQNSLLALTPAAPAPTINPARPANLVAAITLADIGFINGFRFANLGGRREVFVPLPQGRDVTSNELVLVIDDISAHEARRNLEVLVNDRSTIAIALDGKSQARTIRVPLMKSRDGFLKLSFLYSGAATPDRCIDVRYVGDSLTIRPETAIEIDVGAAAALDVATTAALMPREVAIVLPGRRLAASEIVTALTVARTLMTSGRHIKFHQDFDSLSELAKRSDPKRWTRGIVIIGAFDEVSSLLDAPVVTVAGPSIVGALAAVRVGGAPALLISHATAGHLLASPWLTATRGLVSASVGEAAPGKLITDRMTFDQLGVAPTQAEVFGRADLSAAIDMRRLPPGTYPSRLVLDLMIAPDGAGEKAVVSAYVNERLLGTTVAATNEQTRLDMPLPDGLIGTSANIRAMVQRRSAQGDCRFEPQGYPAQILGSSAFVITAAEARANDFSDLATRGAAGLEVILPASAADRPTQILGLVATVLNALSPETAPITVKLVEPGVAPAPTGAFICGGRSAARGRHAARTPRPRPHRGRGSFRQHVARSGRLFDRCGGADDHGWRTSRPLDQVVRRRRRASGAE